MGPGLVIALMVISTQAQEPSPQPSMTQQKAEQLARERWFEFELAPVATTFQNDWVAFVKAKEAAEARLDAEPPPHRRGGPPLTKEEVRAWRALQQEFNDVAMPRTEEIETLARRVLAALQKGDIDAILDDCVGGANESDRKSTRAHLLERRRELKKAALVAGPTQATTGIHFERPSPGTGMVGGALVSFGPQMRAPKGTRARGPFSHEVQLWWQGEVMPEPNGKVNAKPSATRPASRWRFGTIVLPHSRVEYPLL